MAGGPPSPNWTVIRTVEAHTAGEPFRLIVEGVPPLPGRTLLEKRRAMQEGYDFLRTALMREPRGHADMYGGLLVEPEGADSDLGVIFMHNEGYSTMCGHGIIALVKAVLDLGLVRKEGDSPVLRIDTPAGTVRARARCENGEVVEISFMGRFSWGLPTGRAATAATSASSPTGRWIAAPPGPGSAPGLPCIMPAAN